MTLLPDEHDLDVEPDADREPATMLGVVQPVLPPEQAATAMRDAARWVDEELVRLRTERASINATIKSLVVEQDRLRRIVRVLDAS